MTEPHNPARPNESAFGAPRIKAGPGGGALRLATLVRDLMERHQMARADAVLTHLLPPLSESNAPTLYLLQPGGNALPLGGREWFATGSGNPEPGRRFRSGGIAGSGVTFAPVGQSVGRGLVGAVAWLKGVWGNPVNSDAVCMDALDLAAVASRLAVSELDAAAVWGWGSGGAAVAVAASLELEDVETWAQLVEWRLANVNPKNKRGPDWGRGAGKQLRILEAELAQRTSAGAGKSAALNAMGRELGYTGAEPRKPLQKAIDAVRMRKATSPSAAPSSDGVTIVRSGQKVPKPPKAA